MHFKQEVNAVVYVIVRICVLGHGATVTVLAELIGSTCVLHAFKLHIMVIPPFSERTQAVVYCRYSPMKSSRDNASINGFKANTILTTLDIASITSDQKLNNANDQLFWIKVSP